MSDRSLKKKNITLYIAVIIVVICFLLDNFLYVCEEFYFFQRSGSLLVAAGLINTILEISTSLNYLYKNQERLYTNKKSGLISNSEKAKFMDWLKRKEKKFKFVETSMIIAGTLIWAYGDWMIVSCS